MLTFLAAVLILIVLFYAIKFILSAMTPLLAIILTIIVAYIVINFLILRRK